MEPAGTHTVAGVRLATGRVHAYPQKVARSNTKKPAAWDERCSVPTKAERWCVFILELKAVVLCVSSPKKHPQRAPWSQTRAPKNRLPHPPTPRRSTAPTTKSPGTMGQV